RPRHLLDLLLQELPVGVLQGEHIVFGSVQRIQYPDALAHLVDGRTRLAVERHTNGVLDDHPVIDAVGLVVRVGRGRERRVRDRRKGDALHTPASLLTNTIRSLAGVSSVMPRYTSATVFMSLVALLSSATSSAV